MKHNQAGKMKKHRSKAGYANEHPRVIMSYVCVFIYRERERETVSKFIN